MIVKKIPEERNPAIDEFSQMTRPWTTFPRRQILEIVVLLLTVGVGLFTTHKTRGCTIAFGLIWILLTSRNTKEKLGLVWRNSRETLWLLKCAAAIAALIWIVGLMAGNEDARKLGFNPFVIKIGYITSAFVQQFVLLSYIFARLELLLKDGKKAVLLAALLFSLCHAPNLVLMTITFVGGWLSCMVFRQLRNYYTLALSQAMIGTALSTYLPGWVMKAGIGSWRWWNGTQ
jgi:hypothetical protein